MTLTLSRPLLHGCTYLFRVLLFIGNLAAEAGSWNDKVVDMAEIQASYENGMKAMDNQAVSGWGMMWGGGAGGGGGGEGRRGWGVGWGESSPL